MTWLPEDQMADLHIIRQDVARAKASAAKSPANKALAAAYEEQLARRARAIRLVARETEATDRQLAAMFRCTKAVIRAALAEEAT